MTDMTDNRLFPIPSYENSKSKYIYSYKKTRHIRHIRHTLQRGQKMNHNEVKKVCKNCKYALILKNRKDCAPNVICVKRTNFGNGKVYLTQEDDNCRNYFTPKRIEQI